MIKLNNNSAKYKRSLKGGRGKMTKSFDDLIQRLSQVETKKVSVAVAQDDEVLLAVKAAKERGIADSILVGDADLIKPIAEEIGMNLDDYEAEDSLYIVQTIEPIIMEGDTVVKTGTVVLGRIEK